MTCRYSSKYVFVTVTLLLAGMTAGSGCCGGGNVGDAGEIVSDMRAIGLGLSQYAREHNGRYPATLAELDGRYVDRTYFVHRVIPSVPFSVPPSSYRYKQWRPNDTPDAVVLYLNMRGRADWLYVLTREGSVKRLSPAGFEKAVRACGVDYDSLPELTAPDVGWKHASWLVVCICLMGLLALGAWLLFRRRRDLV